MKNICIIGVGGGVCNVIGKTGTSYDFKWEFKNIKYGYISTRIEAIHRIQEYDIEMNIANIQTNKGLYEPEINRTIERKINYLAIGEKTCRGLGTSSNSELYEDEVDMAKKAFYESEKNIDIFLNKLLNNVDLVILVAVFGGGTGTGVLPLLVQKINNMNIETISIIGKPFHFELTESLNRFNNGFNNLKNNTNEIIVIDPDKEVLEKYNKKCSIREAFEKYDLEFTHKIKEIVEKYE